MTRTRQRQEQVFIKAGQPALKLTMLKTGRNKLPVYSFTYGTEK